MLTIWQTLKIECWIAFKIVFWESQDEKILNITINQVIIKTILSETMFFQYLKYSTGLVFFSKKTLQKTIKKFMFFFLLFLLMPLCSQPLHVNEYIIYLLTGNVCFFFLSSSIHSVCCLYVRSQVGYLSFSTFTFKHCTHLNTIKWETVFVDKVPIYHFSSLLFI